MLNTHRNRQLVRDFIHFIDSELMVQFVDDEFYVYIADKLINVTFNNDPLGDRLYTEFVAESFGVSVSPFLMGLLHEVFHIFTYDEQLDKERSLLYYMLQANFEEENYEEYTKMYFAIPSEYKATEGAVNYYLSHKEECENFLSQLE